MNGLGMKVVATLCVLVLGGYWIYDMVDTKLRLYVLDIGQGDAIVLYGVDNSVTLIDGSSGGAVLAKLGKVIPPWKRKIDTVILTHPHADHIAGLLDVAERYEIGRVILFPVCYENEEYDVFLDVIRSNKVEILYSNLVSFSVSGGGLVLSTQNYRMLSGECETFSNINNASVVTTIEYGAFSGILTGDCEVECERELLTEHVLMRSAPYTIYKAGHHCSRTASDEVFLQRIEPEIAVCSCGRGNTFDHPHAETLEKFENMGITYFRTDIDGTISIVTNGTTWQIKLEND